MNENSKLPDGSRLAPEPILRAGNETITYACIFCRNATFEKNASIAMLNALMDAIHEIPRRLVNWEADGLEEVRNHFACFDFDRWPGGPNLLALFDSKLEEYGFVEPGEGSLLSR